LRNILEAGDTESLSSLVVNNSPAIYMCDVIDRL